MQNLQAIDIKKDKKIKLWINACEVSGDLQAALLLQSLKKEYPMLEAIGMGGEKLEEAGQKNYFSIKELSVMGITEIATALPKIFDLWKRIKNQLLIERPDVIMLVDSGEFNFPLAKFAKNNNIPVYYFIPPKVWAWRKGRIKYLKRDVDTILCIFPFEIDFYNKNNIAVIYIQNPLVNSLLSYRNKEKIKNRIALLPGSRKTEVSKLLTTFALSAKKLQEKYKDLEFYIIKAPNLTEEYLSSFWNSIENAPKFTYIKAEERYEFLATCEYAIAASGTATLETALLQVPTIITYKASLLSYIIAKALVTTRAGLANLILDDDVFPEFLQYEVTVTNIVNAFSNWYEQPKNVEKVKNRLEDLYNLVQNPSQKFNIFDKLEIK